jgi:diguanylate cyclase (GGDEF)-like protein
MPRRKEHSPKSEPSNVDGSRARSLSPTSEKPHVSASEIVQEHPEDAPAGWPDVQEKLAAKAGLSLLLVDGRQPPALVVSNNNSICHAFQSSMEYVGLCDPYCGDAHRRALSAGSAVSYKCHAGLQCFTMPVQIGGEQNLAVIGGRAFVSGADYRSLVDRFRAGELNDLLPSEPFNNVIFAEAERLDQLAERLRKAMRNFNASAPAAGIAKTGTESETIAGDAVTTVEFERQLPQPLSNLQQEVDRLRNELAHHSHLAESLQHFLERISFREPSKTYDAILSHTKELLKADRISLWVFDENSNEISLKAATGFGTTGAEEGPKRIGEGISGRVLESGTALVVGNLETVGLTAAPAERKYKTKSFISYPITLSGRKIGVLNVADKTGGEQFDEVDLSLLQIIGPQIAVALERAEWQERATQFQLMSITDPLTGLLNRRYLEERLTDELNRSQRYNYATSCLMIDIDDFKTYNDQNGHQAGDVALKVTAHALKAALRGADVACRYGGEEFCILLPQTSLSEAGVIAERIRQTVAEKEYRYGKSQPLGMVTVSIGISTFAKNIDTAERVIAAADRALYNAKFRGKNRIDFYVDDISHSPAAR